MLSPPGKASNYARQKDRSSERTSQESVSLACNRFANTLDRAGAP